MNNAESAKMRNTTPPTSVTKILPCRIDSRILTCPDRKSLCQHPTEDNGDSSTQRMSKNTSDNYANNALSSSQYDCRELASITPSKVVQIKRVLNGSSYSATNVSVKDLRNIVEMKERMYHVEFLKH